MAQAVFPSYRLRLSQVEGAPDMRYASWRFCFLEDEMAAKVDELQTQVGSLDTQMGSSFDAFHYGDFHMRFRCRVPSFKVDSVVRFAWGLRLAQISEAPMKLKAEPGSAGSEGRRRPRSRRPDGG